MADLYDTCLFIDYWRGDPSAVSLVSSALSNPGAASYSPLTATELWQNPALSRRDEIQYQALLQFLSEVPLDGKEAMLAGQLLRPLSRSMRMRLAADALISATATMSGKTVVTRNVKDLSRFSNNVRSY